MEIWLALAGVRKQQLALTPAAHPCPKTAQRFSDHQVLQVLVGGRDVEELYQPHHRAVHVGQPAPVPQHAQAPGPQGCEAHGQADPQGPPGEGAAGSASFGLFGALCQARLAYSLAMPGTLLLHCLILFARAPAATPDCSPYSPDPPFGRLRHVPARPHSACTRTTTGTGTCAATRSTSTDTAARSRLATSA